MDEDEHTIENLEPQHLEQYRAVERDIEMLKEKSENLQRQILTKKMENSKYSGESDVLDEKLRKVQRRLYKTKELFESQRIELQTLSNNIRRASTDIEAHKNLTKKVVEQQKQVLRDIHSHIQSLTVSRMNARTQAQPETEDIQTETGDFFTQSQKVAITQSETPQKEEAPQSEDEISILMTYLSAFPI